MVNQIHVRWHGRKDPLVFNDGKLNLGFYHMMRVTHAGALEIFVLGPVTEYGQSEEVVLALNQPYLAMKGSYETPSS